MPKKSFACFFCLFVFLTFTAGAQPAYKEVLLKQGTIVTLELEKPVKSDEIAEGDIIPMAVKVNVVAEGETVARTGAYAECIVRSVQHARSFGKAGSLEVVPFNMQLIDQQRVALGGGSKQAKGKNRKALAWTVAILTPAVGALFASSAGNDEAAPFMLSFAALGFAVKGKEAELPLGTSLSALVAKDTYVRVEEP